MRRRILFALVGAAASVPCSPEAQETGRTRRIAFLSFGREVPPRVAILDGLRSMGFVEGRNLAIDERGRGLRGNQLTFVATQLAQLGVDAFICTSGSETIRAAQAATTTIPIIGIADDMVKEGLAGSLANRSGNTTGISILATELDGKRQELLMEALPKIRRMAVLADAIVLPPSHSDSLEAAARSRGVDLTVYRVEKLNDIPVALDAAKASGAQAVNILASSFLQLNRQLILAKAHALGLATMFQWPEDVTDGALLAYGPGQLDTFRHLGRMAGKVLRGARPADLPIEQPASFKLAINLKLAREFGITVPPSILFRADEVIE